MRELEIYKGILEFFKIEELVGSRTSQRYGERALRFFDMRLLHTILVVRKELKRAITINTWHKVTGGFSQRGLRENICSIVKGETLANKLYLSGHVTGKALDFDVAGMTAQEVRTWCVENADRLPYKIRLEDGVGWVHLDVTWEEKNPKVYLFNP